MKTGADFQEAGNAAVESNPTCARFRDAAQYLEQRGLAGAVVADDADAFALADFEIDILQGPELFDLVAVDDRAAGHEIPCLADPVLRALGHDFAPGGDRKRTSLNSSH